MKLAAAAVAETAWVMLEAQPGTVLVLAGSGGNGGDGLYAGAVLAERGVTVHALVPERCHEGLSLRSVPPVARSFLPTRCRQAAHCLSTPSPASAPPVA